MKFTKMHGIGNDFVVVDNIKENIPESVFGKLSLQICNRNFGVGSDGLVFVLPSDVADFTMRMMNPDGSEAEMCGNGIRVFAKYVYDHALTDKTSISVETLAGIKYLDLEIEDGKVNRVRVDMGEPIFAPAQIPMVSSGSNKVINKELDVLGTIVYVTAVSMGNPHCVIFVDEVDKYPVDKFGPALENHRAFPERTNVEFIEVINDQEIKMRVWERGAAETMACGTGACAAAVASALNNKTGRNVLVHLRGGDLSVEWTDDNKVIMTGAAVEVFDGKVDKKIFDSWIN